MISISSSLAIGGLKVLGFTAIVTLFSITTLSLFVPLYAQTSPQQPEGADVSILSSSQIGTDFGSTYIVGEVRNDLSDVVNFVQIVGRFYDSSGLLIDTDFTYTDLDYLRPGEKSPFRLIISDETVAQRINSYTLDVNWDPVFAIPSTIAEATVLTIVQGEQRTNDFGWYQIVGEVVNGGSEPTEFVKVVATFYDEAGQVINTDFTYTDPSDLAAGQSAPFEVTVTDEDVSDDIESVKLTAQSTDYFAIDPELLGLTSTPTTPIQPAPQMTPPSPPQQQQQPPPASAPQLVL
jgi:hypothetical protein